MRSTSLALPCTPRILTSGNPTNSSHMRVGSVSTGALRSEGVNYRQIGRAPALFRGPLKHATPRSFPKSPLCDPIDSEWPFELAWVARRLRPPTPRNTRGARSRELAVMLLLVLGLLGTFFMGFSGVP